MSDRPMATTPLVLAKLLKEFALNMGVSDKFADTLARTHLTNSSLIPKWDEFLTTNCAICPHTPETCAYLHPTEESSQGISPDRLRAANIYALESERLQKCPVLSSIRTLPAPLTAGGGTDDEPTNDPSED